MCSFCVACHGVACYGDSEHWQTPSKNDFSCPSTNSVWYIRYYTPANLHGITTNAATK